MARSARARGAAGATQASCGWKADGSTTKELACAHLTRTSAQRQRLAPTLLPFQRLVREHLPASARTVSRTPPALSPPARPCACVSESLALRPGTACAGRSPRGLWSSSGWSTYGRMQSQTSQFTNHQCPPLCVTGGVVLLTRMMRY